MGRVNETYFESNNELNITSKNLNLPEADQLAMYKYDRGVELEAT